MNAVHEADVELDQLDDGDVLLPPDLNSHACQVVVRVHDRVHEGVQDQDDG